MSESPSTERMSPRESFRNHVGPDDPEEIFEMVEVIGEGAYGMVCTCKDRKNGQIYAIKFLEIEEDEDEYLKKEIDILRESGACPYVVRYFGCYLKEDTLMLVMEYCDGGSALDLLNALGKPFNEEQISAICACVVSGLLYLHSNRIIHRDLKAGNILLSSEGYAKLVAPEVITQSNRVMGYDNMADIWSTAITAIELAEGQPPHFALPSMKVIFVIPKKEPPTLSEPHLWSAEFNDFLSKCLKKNPAERMGAQKLLSHPFIQKGLNKRKVIQELVKNSLPLLSKAREEKKRQKEGGDSGTFSHKMSIGSTISINHRTGTVSFSSSTSSLERE